MNGKTVSTLKGNYMGFVDFDNERYWDVRDQFIFDVIPKDISESLASDSRNRTDSVALLSGDVEQAQRNKEAQEAN